MYVLLLWNTACYFPDLEFEIVPWEDTQLPHLHTCWIFHLNYLSKRTIIKTYDSTSYLYKICCKKSANSDAEMIVTFSS